MLQALEIISYTLAITKRIYKLFSSTNIEAVHSCHPKSAPNVMRPTILTVLYEAAE